MLHFISYILHTIYSSNQICSLFRYHNSGSVGISGSYMAHDGSVHYTQIFYTFHPKKQLTYIFKFFNVNTQNIPHKNFFSHK